MARYFIAVLLATSACAHADQICDYNLAANGWARAASQLNSLETEHNQSSSWFVNSDGDYLSCFDLKSQEICHANYEIHKKLPNGEYETDLIVCME